MSAPLPIVRALHGLRPIGEITGRSDYELINPDGPEAADIIEELYEALDALNDHWNGVGDYDTSPDDEARLQEKVRAALRKVRGEQ